MLPEHDLNIAFSKQIVWKIIFVGNDSHPVLDLQPNT